MPAPAPQAYMAVASRFESIELVQAIIDDLLENRELKEEARHWINLAVREAVANAIKHGNGLDNARQVEIELCCGEGEILIRVRDQGGGFDPAEIRDPLAPENLLKPGGRGIFYMRQLMDEVEFVFGDAGGTEVVLRKKFPAPEATEPQPEEDSLL